MECVTSLEHFVKDEFVPKPKPIPERIVKEIMLVLEMDSCPFCGEPLEKHYLTHKRPLITLNYDVRLRVEHRICVNETCLACVAKTSFYNPSLDHYALPKKRFALDVVFLIGHLIHEKNYTQMEVVNYLWEKHGISISQASVSNYNKTVLALNEALLASDPDKIKERLDKLPCRIYAIDGLSSNKSRTLFVIRDMISGMVLGMMLLDNHDHKTFHDFMEKVFQMFGTPDYMIGDGEPGLLAAVRKYYSDIPYQYCQQHFLNNLGEALMEDVHKTAKSELSRKDALKQVRKVKHSFLKEYKSITSKYDTCKSTNTPEISQFLNDSFGNAVELLEFSETILSRSSKGVFPFYLKVVDTFKYLFKLRVSVNSLLADLQLVSEELQVFIPLFFDCLNDLKTIITEITDNIDLKCLINELETINPLFQEIRRILGQTGKSGKKIHDEIWTYLDSPKHGTLLGESLKILKKRFTMYDKELYVSYDNELVPRTNNDLEAFNNRVKSPIRKRLGQKYSWTYLERQGESIACFHNVIKTNRNVGGTKIRDFSEKTPYERIGVIDRVSVSELMSSIEIEEYYRILARNEKKSMMHRWIRKISKEGFDACLKEVTLNFSNNLKKYKRS